MVVYTDGSYKANIGKGGCGIVFVENGEIVRRFIHYPKPPTTNNRMELMGVILAIENTKGDVTIITDSSYVANGINKGWVYRWIEEGAFTNADLWLRLTNLLKSRPECTIQWGKGHDKCPYNDHADILADMATRII